MRWERPCLARRSFICKSRRVAVSDVRTRRHLSVVVMVPILVGLLSRNYVSEERNLSSPSAWDSKRAGIIRGLHRSPLSTSHVVQRIRSALAWCAGQSSRVGSDWGDNVSLPFLRTARRTAYVDARTSTFQEKTPRAPSTPATCSSLRPAPPPTCGWRTLCELWSINPGHFHQPRTGRTATRDGRRRRRWRRRGEAWTRQDARESATVLLASMWTMQVERRMGCLFGRERRAWRRTPRRNVAQRGRFDPGEEFNTSLASRDRAREKHWFSNRNDSTPIFLTQTHGRGRRKAISLTM
mmetsp:Transcript_6369/g.39739  ORF Transcript_6369/g.39739 Transcript_6369/m.39739 type:complete len:296 (+) Transcript_6369:169-1056(+)